MKSVKKKLIFIMQITGLHDEKEYELLVEDFRDRMSKIMSSDKLEETYKSLFRSKCPTFQLFKIINNNADISSSDFQSIKPKGLKINFMNIMIPSSIVQFKRPKSNREFVKLQIDPPKNAIEAFCKSTNHFYSPLDVISAASNLNLISSEEKKKCIDDLDFRLKDNLFRVYSYISNPLAQGRLIDNAEPIQSYCKKYHPISQAKCSACDKLAESVLNNEYIAVDQSTSDGGKHHIINQTSNKLELIEDNHAALDVECSRCESVYKHLIEHGKPYFHTSPDMKKEIMTMFGVQGSLIMKLVEELGNEKVFEYFKSFFRQRYINLHINRLFQKPEWAKGLEINLPPSRAMFSKVPHKTLDYGVYGRISMPIQYVAKNVGIIQMLFNRLFASMNLQREHVMDMDLFFKMLGYLRLPEGELTDLCYSEAQLLVAMAMLTKKLEIIRRTVDYTSISRRIATEIGLTIDSMSPDTRIVEIIYDMIITHRINLKTGVPEIAGLLRDVNCKIVKDIIALTLISLRALKFCTQNKSREGIIVTVSFEKGMMKMSLKDMSFGNPNLMIDLECFKSTKGVLDI